RAVDFQRVIALAEVSGQADDAEIAILELDAPRSLDAVLPDQRRLVANRDDVGLSALHLRSSKALGTANWPYSRPNRRHVLESARAGDGLSVHIRTRAGLLNRYAVAEGSGAEHQTPSPTRKGWSST